MNRLRETLEIPSPTIAVAITEPLDDLTHRSISENADVAEFRADKFPSHDPNYLLEQANRLRVLPLLLTIRYMEEGGDWSGSEPDRLELYRRLLPAIDGIDVELDSEIINEATEAAHGQDKVVIASSHSFDRTPERDELEEKLAKSKETNADYLKIAASARTIDEYQILADFLSAHRDDGLIVVAMNEFGPLSRIAFPGLGSHLTYASAGSIAVAPGQLTCLETRELIAKFYPNPIIGDN